jgi:hypothetical protein
LFSRVMWEGLSTGPGARRHESGLSGPAFSGPVDCADLVNFCKQLIFHYNYCDRPDTSTLVALG